MADQNFISVVSRLANPIALQQYIATRPIALRNLYLANILPPVSSTMAEINMGYFRIVTEPAPLTATDSPYHPVASIQSVVLQNSTAKITGKVVLNESQQDAMHARAQSAILRGGNATPVFEDFITKLIEDGIMLSLDYGEESMRAQVLAFGKLQVQQGSPTGMVQATADFGVPATNFLDRSTNAKGSYAGPNSTWWADVAFARNYLLIEPEIIMNPATYNALIANPINQITQVERTQVSPTVVKYKLGKYAQINGANSSLLDPDVTKQASVTVYGNRGDSATTPYFWPDKQVTFYRPGTRPVEMIDGAIVQGTLGVTHIGPNTEAGFLSQRFVNVVRDEYTPYQVTAMGAEDLLPCIMEPRSILISTTAIV